MQLYSDVIFRLLFGSKLPARTTPQGQLPTSTGLAGLGIVLIAGLPVILSGVFLNTSFAGLSALAITVCAAFVAALLLLIIAVGYRESIWLYTKNADDYQVSSASLGNRSSLLVAACLLVDSALLLGVLVSGAARYLQAIVPALYPHVKPVSFLLAALVLLAILRGAQVPIRFIAACGYVLMAVAAVLALLVVIEPLVGFQPLAPSAAFYGSAGVPELDAGRAVMLFVQVAAIVLTLAVGVNAIPSAKQRFQKPKSKHASQALIGAASATAVLAIGLVYAGSQVRVVLDVPSPAWSRPRDIDGVSTTAPFFDQLAAAVFNGYAPARTAVDLVVLVVALLAAFTVAQSWVFLVGQLSRDSLLPRQFFTRRDRASHAYTVASLAIIVVLLLWVTDASVWAFLQLLGVGSLLAIAIAHIAASVSWTRKIRKNVDADLRGRMLRFRAMQHLSAGAAFLALLILTAGKITGGVGLAYAAIMLLSLVLMFIKWNYLVVGSQLRIADWAQVDELPSRVKSLVLIERLDAPALQAIRYALALDPATLQVITVQMDPIRTKKLQKQWLALHSGLPLTMLDAPQRDLTRAVEEYVRSLRRRYPRDLVQIHIPYYLVRHWWQGVLFNRTVSRLKRRLQYLDGVVVSMIPWQLKGFATLSEQRELFATIRKENDLDA
ncbi:MAG: hypothetical protein SOS98_04110 [Varibaculum sp.]|nr:hypothetical protein [Varibaculum sp.]